MSHQGYPKDPSGPVGEERPSARGQVGPPDLRRQGDHLSKTSSLIHSFLDAAIRPIMPSLDRESGNAGFPPISDLARGVIWVESLHLSLLPFPLGALSWSSSLLAVLSLGCLFNT